MSIRWSKVATTSEVYWLLLNTHKDHLCVFESFSDPDGSFTGGAKGEMKTVWGLKGADVALFGAESSWDIEYHSSSEHPWVPRRANVRHEYWLCKPREEQDD